MSLRDNPAVEPVRSKTNLRLSARLQLRACAAQFFYATSRVSDADNQWTDQKIRRADVVRRRIVAGKPPGPHRPRWTKRGRENDALPPHSAQRIAGRWRNHVRAQHDGRLPPAGNRTGRRRDRARTGYRDFAGVREAAAPGARLGRRAPGRERFPRQHPRSLQPTGRASARSQGEEDPRQIELPRIRFQSARSRNERRLGDARAPGAVARAGARPADARRTDEPPRPRGIALVPGLSEELSRRDPDDFARPRVPQPTRWQHRRGPARQTGTLPG